MMIKRASEIRSSEITPRALYMNRRELLSSAGGLALAFAAPLGGETVAAEGAQLTVTKRSATTSDPPSSFQTVTTFNNFYEFGTDKADPARNSGRFKPRPWSVAVEGLCGRPGVYTLEDVL